MASPVLPVAPPAPVVQPAQPAPVVQPVPNLVPAAPAPQVAPAPAIPTQQQLAAGAESITPVPANMSARQLETAAAQAANRENAESIIGQATEANALQAQADLEKRQAAEMAPLVAEQQKRAAERTQAFTQAKEKLDAFHEKTMGDYQQVLADMQKYATPYKSLWDAAGVSPVRATIGLIISGIGAGLAHQENAALARINQLANFNIGQQKQQYEAAQTRGQMLQNAYGMAREKFGDDKLAMNALYDNQLEDLKQQTAAVANRFSSPLAQANANKLIGHLTAEQARVRGEASNRALQLGAGILHSQLEQQRLAVTLGQAMQDQQLPDVLGTIPKHAVPQMQKLMEGTNELVDQINYVQRLIDTPGIDKSQIVDALNQQGPFFKAMVDFMGISPKFAQMEGGMIKDLSPGKWKTALGSVGLGDFSDIREKLESVKNTARRLSASELKGLGLAPNPASPLYKDWIQAEAAKSGR